VTAHHHAAGQGPVVLDIGGDVGALVLVADADMVGQEIEISRVGDRGPRSHVAVHRRQTPGGVVYAAVYPGLGAGQYLLWPPGNVSPVGPVAVPGGQVTQVSWSQLVVPE
jgi:hypothetical protein